MPGLATENWWSTFLDAHGRDSEEEAAFNGFLTTNDIPPWSDPGALQEAYTQFRQWMEESEEREADRGPDRATLAAEAAVAELEQQFIAKSRVSAPGVEKPRTAVTRPKESREGLAEAGPGPEGQANVTPASGEEPPQQPQVRAGSEPPDPNVTAAQRRQPGAPPLPPTPPGGPTPAAPGPPEPSPSAEPTSSGSESRRGPRRGESSESS